MGGVKAETVQPRSLTRRLERTKVYMKFICTGDCLAIRVYEMTLPDIQWLYGNQTFAATTSLKSVGRK